MEALKGRNLSARGVAPGYTIAQHQALKGRNISGGGVAPGKCHQINHSSESKFVGIFSWHLYLPGIFLAAQ